MHYVFPYNAHPSLGIPLVPSQARWVVVVGEEVGGVNLTVNDQ